jgi:hypothetical protein
MVAITVAIIATTVVNCAADPDPRTDAERAAQAA